MVKARFSNFYRRGLYLLFSLSWLTGSGFFALSRWFSIEGDFGPEKHPWQFPVLMSHGALAFMMMFFFGFVMASHVSITWKMKRNRLLGITLACAVSFQIISAYFLYYLANEVVREVIANLHAAIGFSLPIILTIHIIYARRTRLRAKKLAMAY